MPAEFQKTGRIEPGLEFDVVRLDRGTTATDWLLACPQKNFFVPFDSALTDAL